MKKCLLAMTLVLVVGLVMPLVANAQEMNNGLENFRSAANYGNTDLPTAMGRIMSIVLGFLGLVCAVIIISGGFKWMTSSGDETKIAEAKKLMAAGVIGIIIVVLAYAVASYLTARIQDVTN
ncbi:MAG: pilin [Patescibacteria group bacterium]|nr:pilin [Patescibacteria group bacterium]MDD5164118.1 pilin [Patescibacteria group bacterium]MDD5534224.1 pilin [Patescibacteria group bacterium]